MHSDDNYSENFEARFDDHALADVETMDDHQSVSELNNEIERAEEASSVLDERSEMMKGVDAYIATMSGSAFGDFGTFKRPFSSNFKAAARGYFDSDADVYDRVDASERYSYGAGLRLRTSTGVAYLLKSLFVLVCGVALIGNAEDPSVFDGLKVILFKNDGNHLWVGGAGFLGLGAAWLVRIMVRHVVLGEIRTDVANMASFVIARLSRINDAVTNALDRSETDRIPRTEWPKRAGEWVSIALWNEERYRQMDRYVTACAWRVESTFRLIERGFQTFNTFVAVGVVLYLLHEMNEAEGQASEVRVVFLVLLVAYIFSCLVWTLSSVAQRLKVSGFQQNSFWGDIFGESFSQFGEEKRHVFRKVAERVARDKSTIIDLSPGGN